MLSGGKSERMGSPKALLPYRGKTFLEHILEVVADSGITQTCVVVGHHRDLIGKSLSVPNLVYNPRYAEGMSTSVQAGIRALGKDVTVAVVFLVDHTAVSPQTVRQLIAHAASDRIVLPVFNGRRGHPVAFGRDLFDEILALDSTQGLNLVVRREPSRIAEVSVNDPGVLVDVDTPDQFKKLLLEGE